MNQLEEMQEQLDGLFYKAISRILFLPDRYRKRYADVLASMVSAIQSGGNTLVFREACNELRQAIEQTPALERGQSDLIGFFEGRYIPLDQRMKYIEIQIGKIGTIEKTIEKMKHNISQKVTKNSMKRKKEKTVPIHQDEKKHQKDHIEIPETNTTAPVVPKKNDGKRKIRCPEGHIIDSVVAIGKRTSCSQCGRKLGKSKAFMVKE